MTAERPALIGALLDPRCYDHPVERVELIETHISWVLLTGRYAYKIKKPVDLGFLDFSTLERRRFFCEEELRLNRRLAPQLYLAVVPIAGRASAPVVGGAGSAIEYAVKMRQFPAEAELPRVLARGGLRPQHFDRLAAELAAFHASVAVADPTCPYGTPQRVLAPMAENFRHIRPLLEADERERLAALERWTEECFVARRERLAARRNTGHVRECHGDLHLANMALLDERIVVFDCLEFNPELRWIDVMSEVAFLTMDLDDRGRAGLSRRFLNAYLEHTGDYGGAALLRFYQVYRALVRAKVACIRRAQHAGARHALEHDRNEYRGYLELATRYTHPAATPLAICHGYSGSGKTWVSQQLLEARDALRVRSDVERKRLHGLAPTEASRSALGTGIYTAAASETTYARLAELAGQGLDAGFPVIVDAAFLGCAQRRRLRELARRHRVPFAILDVRTPADVARSRITARQRAGRDASEADLAILEHQLKTAEPLGAEEAAHVVAVDAAAAVDARALWTAVESRPWP